MSAGGRRLAAALLGLALATAGLAPARPAAAQEPLPMLLRLAALVPVAPQPGQVVTVTGRLVNTSSQPVHDLRVRLRLGSAIGNRSALAAYADGGDAVVGTPLVATEHPTRTTSLAPGASVPFLLHLDTKRYAALLPGPGVYPLVLEARGSTDHGFGPVARLRTFLPWAPVGQVPHPTRLAWVWPLVDRPHRAGSRVFRDDALAGELAPGGRLTGLLDAAVAAAKQRPSPPTPGHPQVPVSPVPVTWALDPLLAEDVAVMAGGYQVAAPGEPQRPGGGQAAARDFATALRGVLGGGVIATGYADPDVVALVRQGLVHDLAVAGAAWRQALPADLSSAVLPGIAWPPGGRLDRDALEALQADNVDAVVLSDTSLPPAQDVPYTPSAHVQVSTREGTVDAVVTDSTLGSVVDSGAADPRLARLAEQRFLGETLLVTLELPNTPRDVVVAPDRRWSPAPDYAARLLADTGRVPWLRPVTVSDVLAAPVSTVPRDDLRYPATVQDQELPGGYLSVVEQARRSFRTLDSLLADPSTPFAHELNYGLLRTESSAWRADLASGSRLRDEVAGDIDRALGQVRVVSSGLVTLTSRSGTVPITVANDLGQPVRVLLHLDAGSRAELGSAGTVVQTVAPQQRVQLEVRAKARTAGVFPLRVWLSPTTEPDERLGGVVTLYVRSTAYGSLALGITGGAVAVLFVAVAVRLVRRAVRARGTRRAD